MKPYLANLMNTLALIGLSSWGYLSSETPSITALIPLFIGIILLILTPGIRKENKMVAHIAVLLTLVVLIGLIKPLLGVFERGDTVAIIRVCIMVLSSIIAMVAFVLNFIAAKKNKAANTN
jgi:hypothetical protein